jgi:N-acetylneuraminic acid mutarotase
VALPTGSPSPPRPPRVHVTTVMQLPAGVSRAVAAPVAGRLLVLGGLRRGDVTTDQVWSVDLTTRTTTVAGHLAVAVHDACGVVLHDKVFVFGGGAAQTVATVQEFSNGHARVVGALPQPRSDSSCTQIGGTGYVVGGFDGHAMTRDVLATSDGVHFRVVARLRVGVRYPAVTAVGDRYLVVAGGALATTEGTASGAQTSDVQRVDTVTGHVAVVSRLPHPLAHATGVTVDNKAVVVGGRRHAAAIADVQWVEPTIPLVSPLGSLPTALSDAAAAVVGGTSYVIGGETSGPAAPIATVFALRLVV